MPDLTIILNHIGGLIRVGPYAGRDDVMDTWRQGIAAVAESPNVVCKLGGIGMPRTGFDWHTRNTPIGSEELASDMAPLINYCIEQFGPSRCMFEATSRWTRSPIPTTSFTTPSSGSRRAIRPANGRICSTTRRRGCTTLAGKARQRITYRRGRREHRGSQRYFVYLRVLCVSAV